MASFEEAGFLSDELDQWKRAAHEAYADAFGYAYRANGMALRIMKTIPMTDISDEMKWAIAAFARALGAFQCSILMIERGAMADARALARLCAETVIVAKGLVTVDGTLEILREDDANHGIHAITRILEMNAENSAANEKSLELLKAKLAELESAFPKRRSLKYRDLALRTDLELFYEIAYRYTSGDGAHATLGAFVRHVKEQDGTHGYFFGPDIADMASTLLTVNVAITEHLVTTPFYGVHKRRRAIPSGRFSGTRRRFATRSCPSGWRDFNDGFKGVSDIGRRQRQHAFARLCGVVGTQRDGWPGIEQWENFRIDEMQGVQRVAPSSRWVVRRGQSTLRAMTQRCTSDGPSKMRISRASLAICCNGISFVMPIAPSVCIA